MISSIELLHLAILVVAEPWRAWGSAALVYPTIDLL
jgi:hypothetical protein